MRLQRIPNGSQFRVACTDIVLWKPTPAGAPIAAKEVTGLLRAFGITRHEIYEQTRPLRFNGRYFFRGRHVNFWDRSIDHCALFQRARKNFRSLMKQLRPNIETSQEAIDIIAKWTWLKKLYKQHYPEI